MIVSSEALALMRAGTVSIVPVMLIDTPTPVRIAASFGAFPLSADAVDTTGGNYLGIGTLGDMPALANLVNGTASRGDFSIAAFGAQGQALADAFEADTSDLKSAKVYIGFLLLDTALQLAANFWLWAGTIDKTSIGKRPGSGALGPEKTVTISVGSRFIRRSQGKPSYYTDSDQKLRSADDDFCINVKGYAGETTKPWPA